MSGSERPRPSGNRVRYLRDIHARVHLTDVIPQARAIARSCRPPSRTSSPRAPHYTHRAYVTAPGVRIRHGGSS